MALPETEGGATDPATAWTKARIDFVCALKSWPIVALIGASDVASRYRRSSLGQLWITISHAVTIIAIGVIWAYIWKQPIADFLPYLAVGQVFWLYITGVLSDATTVFTDHANYLNEINLPRSLYLLSNIIRHLIVLGHNSIILLGVFSVFGFPFTTLTLLFFPAFLLATLAAGACSVVLAIGGVRYRDLSSIVASLIGVAFFLTPVIWKLETLPTEVAQYMAANPFAIFVELLRAPLLGVQPPPGYWLAASVITALMMCVAAIVFVRCRGRITYWL